MLKTGTDGAQILKAPDLFYRDIHDQADGIVHCVDICVETFFPCSTQLGMTFILLMNVERKKKHFVALCYLLAG